MPAIAAEETQTTRGEFFNLIAEVVGADDAQSDQTLPTDVASDSPYANSVLVLIEKEILAGYPDGTVKPEEPIQTDHATFLLARAIGVADQDAIAYLNEKYGIELDQSMDVEAAKQAVAKVLKNDSEGLKTDPEVLDLVKRSTQKQLEQESFRAEIDQLLTFQFSEDAPAEIFDFIGDIQMTSVMDYHLKDGMYMKTTVELNEGEDLADIIDFGMEQYLVPSGMYMKMADAVTGEEEWIVFDDEELFDFEELQEMQQANLNFLDQLDNQSFVYHHEGEELLDGQQTYKIGMSGKISSMSELLEMMEAIIPSDQGIDITEMIDEVEELITGATISSTTWLDQETLLPVRIEMNMELGYASSPFMPIESMGIQMNMNVFDYNKVESITLPEEAKDALSFEDLIEIDEDWLEEMEALELEEEIETEDEIEVETETELEEDELEEETDLE